MLMILMILALACFVLAVFGVKLRITEARYLGAVEFIALGLALRTLALILGG